MTRREFLKALTAAAASGLPLPALAMPKPATTTAGERMELGTLGYTEGPHAGVRLRWTVPPLVHHDDSGELTYRGLPTSVMVQRADLADLGGDLHAPIPDEDRDCGGGPGLGHVRSTFYPYGWWQGRGFHLSQSASRPRVVGFFPALETDRARVAAARLTVEQPQFESGDALRAVRSILRDDSVLDRDGGVERVIRRVSALAHDGSCLWRCVLDSDQARLRLDAYVSDATFACFEVEFTSEIEDIGAVEGLFLEGSSGLYAKWLDLDDTSLHESLDWKDVAEVQVAGPLTNRSDTHTWQQFRHRINDRSTFHVPDALRDTHYAADLEMTREDWDALLALAAYSDDVCRGNLNDDTEHAPAAGVPRQGAMLDIAPWEAFDLLLAERWEYATLAGFGFLDGRRAIAHGLEDIRAGAGLLSERPRTDLAYRVVPKYGGLDDPFREDLASNVAVANNNPGAVPELAAPFGATASTPLRGDRPFEDLDAIATRVSTLTPIRDGDAGPVPSEPVRSVLVGDYRLDIEARRQAHASAVMVYEHVPERVTSGVADQADGSMPSHGAASSWEYLRLDVDAGCVGNVDSGLVTATDRTFVTERWKPDLRLLAYSCDPWDRVSEDAHEVVRRTVVTYRPEAPDLTDARVVSPKHDRAVEIRLRLLGPEDAAEDAGRPRLGPAFESWDPPDVLRSAGDVAGRIDVMRRTRPVRRWHADVASRSERFLHDDHGWVYAYRVDVSAQPDGAHRDPRVWRTSFFEGTFAAGDHAGTIAGVEWPRKETDDAKNSDEPPHTVYVRASPPVLEERESRPIDDAIPDVDPCAGAIPSGQSVAEVFSPPLRGTLTERETNDSLWSMVRSEPLDSLTLPISLTFEDGERPRPSDRSELREYAARVTLRVGDEAYQGDIGNAVQALVLPVPPGTTPPFDVLDHGRDVYGRTLLEVHFPGHVDRDGLFEVGWALETSDAGPVDDPREAERLLAGVIGAQRLSGSSLFELVDTSGSLSDTTSIIVGVRSVDEAGQKGPYRIHDTPIQLATSTRLSDDVPPPTRGSVDG